jgi:hypothetical protein
MLQVGFESKISVFERLKTGRNLRNAATASPLLQSAKDFFRRIGCMFELDHRRTLFLRYTVGVTEHEEYTFRFLLRG